jgi:uncharacterized protein (UPF0335 family)
MAKGSANKRGKQETVPQSNSGGAVARYVERYENLDERKADLAEDYKQLGAEVKAEGFDAAVIKQLVKLRRDEKARKRFALVQTYAAACQLDLFGEPEQELDEAA